MEEPTEYRYELWRGEELVATGRFAESRRLRPGEAITIGRSRGVVREVAATVGTGELRLVVDLVDP